MEQDDAVSSLSGELFQLIGKGWRNEDTPHGFDMFQSGPAWSKGCKFFVI